LHAEIVLWDGLDDLEPGGGVDLAGGILDGVGPQAHALVATGTRKDHRLGYKGGADALPARGRLDIEHSELGRALEAVRGHDEDGTDDGAILFGHPQILGWARGRDVKFVVDAGNQRLEVEVPAE